MSKLNEHYQQAVNAVKSIDKGVKAMWPGLVLFTVEAMRLIPNVKTPDMKPAFKAAEKQATVEAKVRMNENSTYRVQKGLLCNCVSKGITIVDGAGKPRGKTELEDELAALKDEKSPLDKFKTSMNTANALADKFTTMPEYLSAASLVNDLMKKLTPHIKAAA